MLFYTSCPTNIRLTIVDSSFMQAVLLVNLNKTALGDEREEHKLL